MKHIYVAVLMTILSDTAMALGEVMPEINRLIKRNATRIIQHCGKDIIYAPSGFLNTPVNLLPLQQFSKLAQISIDINHAIVEHVKTAYPHFQDPRTPYEKTLSSFKREQLLLEMSLRPKKLTPLTFSTLELKKPEGRSIRYVATNEIDLTCADHAHPIMCAWDVGVSVAVILSNTKKKTAFMAHVMETAILDGAFKKGVKEICNESDANDLYLSMLTTNISDDSSITAGIQNKLSQFFKLHASPTIKQKNYILAQRPGGTNIGYDPRDNSTYTLHQNTTPCFTSLEEVEFSLRHAARSTAWFQVDFNNRSELMKLDGLARINHYYNLLNLPFTLFEQMAPLGLKLEHADFPYSLTTKEDVLQHFFKEIL